jgi:hypothetical protein
VPFWIGGLVAPCAGEVALCLVAVHARVHTPP